MDPYAIVERIAKRDPARSEATLQAEIRTLLLAAPLNLADDAVVNLETPAGPGRIDVETGFTVIEVKRDLRSKGVREKALEQLAGYVRHRSETVGGRYVGILTDGAEWRLYRLSLLSELEEVGDPLIVSTSSDAANLFVWLESVLATAEQIQPIPAEIEQRLGAESPAHELDYADLSALYHANKTDPTVAVKRELWAKLLTTALGANFNDDDDLFIEHTLLVATAEIIAHAAIGLEPAVLAPASLLSGALFDEKKVRGVVESDFFDWIIEVEGGDAFVRGLARRLNRFDWNNVKHDVMKVLYESVIGASERYGLGEYYTPDWLAERMVKEIVKDPLNERVLDPACGSGTFLFQAIRHYLDAADDKGLSNEDALRGVTNNVLGIDLHPLAVTFARLTYLLAIGSRIKKPRGALRIPVFLGDSLRWGQKQDLLGTDRLRIPTGEGGSLFANELVFHTSLISDADRFDDLIADLTDRATSRPHGSSAPELTGLFRRFPVNESEKETIKESFRILCDLHDQRRDHIWGYYVRNLSRPTWLTLPPNRVDVLIGNPPWLTYNAIATDLKAEFRAACEERNLWAGGPSARNYDLAALFVVRAVELYLKSGGRFGFVMPFATLSRRQYRGFRTGEYSSKQMTLRAAFSVPWDLSRMRPHPFPVPCCAVFGTRTEDESPTPVPLQTIQWRGQLPDRNVNWTTAKTTIETDDGAISEVPLKHASPYAQRFEAGAKLNPQVLVLVEPAPEGPLGVPEGYQSVRSVRSEKGKWKNVEPLEGTIEAEFVRPLHLGSTLLPFRFIDPKLAVVPWDSSQKRLFSADDSALDRYPRLAKWWRTADQLWQQFGTPDKYDLTGRVDYQKKITRQLPARPNRIAYGKSGSRLTAARIEDEAITSEKLYWATMASLDEARYVTAILNSQAMTDRVAPYQSQGQFGTRDFDKYVWYVPVPEFSPDNEQHQHLVALAARAETVAATVELAPTFDFRNARKRVRDALEEDGVAILLEEAVTNLLENLGQPKVE